MCFVHDAEWSASVQDVTEGPAEATRCDECGEPIAAGEWRRHIFQQQYEECQVCCNPPDCECLEAMAHEYGHTYDYDCCQRCANVLQAVRAREIAEGCPPHGQQPPLAELWDQLTEHQDGLAYVELARQMFPDLAGDELLERVAQAAR